MGNPGVHWAEGQLSRCCEEDQAGVPQPLQSLGRSPCAGGRAATSAASSRLATPTAWQCVCRSIRFASGARGGEEMGRGVPVRGRASAARRALLSAWPASVLASLRSALARVHGSVRMCAGVSNPYPAQTSQASPLLRLGLLPPAPRVLCQGNPSAEQMSSGKERGGAELSPGGDQGSLEQPCCLPWMW